MDTTFKYFDNGVSTPYVDTKLNPKQDKVPDLAKIPYQAGKFVFIHTDTVLAMSGDISESVFEQRKRSICDFWKTEEGELQNLLFCNAPEGFVICTEDSSELKIDSSLQTLADGEVVNMITAYGDPEFIQQIKHELSAFTTVYIMEYINEINTYMPSETLSGYTLNSESQFHATA